MGKLMDRRVLCLGLLALTLMPSIHGCVPTPPPTISSLDTSPAWSPDGRLLAYAHQDLISSSTSYPSGVYVVDLETLRRIPVTLGFARSVDWLRDGLRIVFDSAAGLFIGDTLGTPVALVLGGATYFPACASTSDTVAFDDLGAVGFVDATTGSAVFPPELSATRDPAWSPDDSRIAVHRGYPGAPFEEIAVFDRRLRTYTRITANTYPDRDPAWSPDGSHLAWIAWPPGRGLGSGPWLQIADSQGAQVSRVARGEGAPDWSPDGAEVAFTATSGMATSVFVITLTTGSVRRITF